MLVARKGALMCRWQWSRGLTLGRVFPLEFAAELMIIPLASVIDSLLSCWVGISMAACTEYTESDR